MGTREPHNMCQAGGSEGDLWRCALGSCRARRSGPPFARIAPLEKNEDKQVVPDSFVTCHLPFGRSTERGQTRRWE